MEDFETIKELREQLAERDAQLKVALDLIDWIVEWEELAKTNDKGLAEFIIAESVKTKKTLQKIGGVV